MIQYDEYEYLTYYLYKLKQRVQRRAPLGTATKKGILMDYLLPTQAKHLTFGHLEKFPGVSVITLPNGSLIVKDSRVSGLKYLVPGIKKPYRKATKSEVIASFDNPSTQSYLSQALDELPTTNIMLSLPANHSLWTSAVKQAELVPPQLAHLIQPWLGQVETDNKLFRTILDSPNNFIWDSMVVANGCYFEINDVPQENVLLSAFIIKRTSDPEDDENPLLITFGGNRFSDELPSTLILPASEWLSCVNYYALTAKSVIMTGVTLTP